MTLPAITLLQPALPNYRLDFFDRLADRYGDQMTVYFSPANLGALSGEVAERGWARRIGPFRRVLPGLFWQSGAAALPVGPGDVVVVNGNPRFLSSLALLVRCRLLGAHTIWWGQYWSSTSRSLQHALRLLLMRASDAVLFYTDKEVSEYRAGRGRHDHRPIGALNNGIAIEPIQSARLAYGAAERARGALFIGRLTKKARLDLGLEALTHIPDKECVLHVIGWGDSAAELQAHAAKLGVAERVRWHGAINDEARIAEIANNCRLFVYPGEVGLSLIHGMAYGLPAVVHNNRWKHMPEIAAFTDNRTGRSFQHGNAEDLACVLTELISDEPELDRLSASAAAEVETKFTTQGMAKRFCSLVDELIATQD